MKLHCRPGVRWSVATLSMGLAKAAVAATSNDPAIPSIFNPASTPAHDIYHLSLFVHGHLPCESFWLYSV